MTIGRYPGRKMSYLLVALIAAILLVPIIYIIINWIDPDFVFIIYILISLIIFLVIIWVIIDVIRNRKYTKKTDINFIEEPNVVMIDEIQRPTIREKLTFAKEKQLLKEINDKIQTLSHIGNITGQICQLSKTKFSEEGIAIQCQKCLAIFKKKYLVVWFLRSPICPVCRAVMIELKSA